MHRLSAWFHLTLVPLTTTFQVAPGHMMRCSRPRAQAITALTRREVLPPLGFTLLFARLGYLASTKEELILPSESVFDPVAAIAKAETAALCAVQSCVDNKLAELQYYLDTSTIRINSKGDAAYRTPVVYVAPDFGLSSASVARYNVIVAVPTPPTTQDPVEIIWLKNAESGVIVASKTFSANNDVVPATLLATLKEPFAGIKRGATLVPYSYSKRDGVWEGTRFTLPGDSSGSSTNALGPREIGAIDARGKRPAADIGKELLKKAGIDL
jgi:hypothetical protein